MATDGPLCSRGVLGFVFKGRIEAQLRPDSVVYAVPGQHEWVSFQSEATGYIPEQRLVGATAGQVHPHTTGVARDNRPDLQELQPDRAALRLGKLRARQRQAPYRLHQDVGQR